VVADPYNKQSIRTELACVVSVETCSGKVSPHFRVYSRNREGNKLVVKELNLDYSSVRKTNKNNTGNARIT